MRPANVFQLEIAVYFAGPQSLIMKLCITLLLGLPFVMIEMPLRVRLAGLLILIIFISFFGAAVMMVRRRTDGHLNRLKLLPIPSWVVWADILLAETISDLIQMGIVLALFLAVNGLHITSAVLLLTAGLFAATLIIFNVLGIFLGFIMKDNPQVHLIGTLFVFIIAFISGLMPVPERLRGIIDAVQPLNPLGYLYEALAGITHGSIIIRQREVWPATFLLIVLSCFLLFRGVDWAGIMAKNKIEKSTGGG